MEKTKIFGIGISGLVGSRIVTLLPQYSFDNLSLETGVDITNPETLSVIRDDTEHDWVLHLAAKADVDGCEQDKPLGKDGAAYTINVLGTQHVVDACKAAGKKLIYISTDFVFDGDLPEGQAYTEEDTPAPIDWYAQTKFDGEEIVKHAGIPYLIVRIAYPYQKDAFALKKDFYHAMKDRLIANLPVAAVTDHIMTPTYLDDIALALGKLIETNAEGIYHVVGDESLSPYDVAITIADTFHLDKSLISKTTRDVFFKDRAPRPFNLALNNAKIKKIGVSMRGFAEVLKSLSL